MASTDTPPLRIAACIADRREPGHTLFNVRPGGGADRATPGGWLVGIDRNGSVAFSRAYETPPQDTKSMPNGNILSAATNGSLITEMTLAGEVVRQWYAVGKWTDTDPPADAIPVDVPLFHHRVNLLPDGNMLILTMEIREFTDWPSSDTDRDAPLETAKLAGDVVVEFSPDGTVIGRWHLFDLLDPYRLCYGSRNPYWQKRGFADSMDWCHANAVSHDPRDDSLLVSLRHQDCIIKIDRRSGDLVWILGDPGNWRAPWSDSLLHPAGDIAWQYHQHDCSVTPDGTVLCFDNGNYRAVPYGEKVPPQENRSRLVEFAINEDAMTVRQVWSWDDANGEDTSGKNTNPGCYACYQGGAFRLPKTGNTLMTYGGIVTVDGEPGDVAETGFCRSRIVEVTPEGDIVFDLWIDGSAENMPLSSFRAEHYPA